jgi:hypothetical protein
MKWLDALLGRSRPARSNLEPLFAMSGAYVTLSVQLGLAPAGRGGVCLRPVQSTRFAQARDELRAIVGGAGTQVEFAEDRHGFLWVLIASASFEELVAAMHMTSLTLQEHGFAEQLLAAVFPFQRDGAPVYFIYNYKRGRFYPMAPDTGGRERDNALELRLASLLERELPMEPDQARWFPLWDMPL